jgi:hypothetical protein
VAGTGAGKAKAVPPAASVVTDRTEIDGGDSEAAIADTAWAWGPYLLAGGAAAVARGLASLAGGGAVVLVAAALLVPPAVLYAARRAGKPLGGIDQVAELAYCAALSGMAACWTFAVGVLSWPAAAVLAAAGGGGALAWWLWGVRRYTTGITATIAAPAFGVLLVAFNPLAAADVPARWVAAGLLLTTCSALPFWRRRREAKRRASLVPPEPAVDIAPTLAALGKHLRCGARPLMPTLVTSGVNWTVRLRLADGGVLADVLGVVERVESEMGLRAGAITATASTKRNEITFSCAPELCQAIDAPEVWPDSILDAVAFGRHDTGGPMQLRAYTEDGAWSGMLAGQTGAGKSRAVYALMAKWTAARDVVFLMGDMSGGPAGGPTSWPWKSCLLALETEAPGVMRLLDALLIVAQARSSVLAERGWESWRPSREHPALVVVVDEAQKVMGEGTKVGWAAASKAEQAFQVIRKSGIVLLLVSPVPEQGQGISPIVREQSHIRLAMASPGKASKYVLGGSAILGSAPGLDPVPGVVSDVPMAEAQRIAAEHADRRPELDALSVEAFARAGYKVARAPAHQVGDGVAQPVGDGGSPVAADGGSSAGADGGSPPAGAGLTAQGLTADTGPTRWTELDGTWTTEDEQAAYGLKDEMRAAAERPLMIGDQEINLTPVQIPEVPIGRMTVEQAIQVAAALVTQPGGTSAAAIRAATGYKHAWSFRLLNKWVAAGWVEHPEEGRYIAVAPPPATPDAEPVAVGR